LANPFWVKGVSPNPGGKHRLAKELRVKCLRIVDEVVIDRWKAEVASEGPDWFKCSALLAAYGLGRPPETSADEGEDHPAVQQRTRNPEDIMLINRALKVIRDETELEDDGST